MFKDEDTQDAQLKAQKDRALAVIALSINTEHQIHIIDCTSPQDAWKNLEQVFEPKSRSRILQFKKQFVNIKLQTGESMLDYLNRLKICTDHLKEAGAEVDDQDIAYSMLSGLPDSFDTLVMSFGNVEDFDFTSNKVRNTLLTEYERRSARKGASSGLGEALNFSKDDTRETSRKQGVKCYRCSKIGHIAKDCRSSINRDYKADKRYSRKKDSFKSPSENMLMAFNAVSSEDEFILDSGATHHVCKNRQWFTSFQPTTCEPIQTASGNLQVEGAGNIRMKMYLYTGTQDVTLNDVLFVPQARINLLSVSQTEDKGKHIKICNHKARVFNDNRHKDQVIEYFDIFRAIAERETGHKIKRLRTDNGLEYCNKNFKQKLESLGIKHELTNSYSPQQNGVSERLNRSLLDMARASMHNADLPQKFWAESVNCAAYIKNRSLCSALDNKVPEEIRLSRKVSVRHFKIFGALAYAHIPKQKRKKFDRRAKRCILVGYSTQSKGYRLWDNDSKQVFITKHARFDENKVGLNQLKDDVTEGSEAKNKVTPSLNIVVNVYVRVICRFVDLTRKQRHHCDDGDRLKFAADLGSSCESQHDATKTLSLGIAASTTYKIRLLNQTHLTKEEKINLLTDGLPNDWKDLIVAAQPTDTTKWFHIAASIEQNRASIQFKPKNKIHLATKNNDNRKNVCPFWCPICSKKGIKIKHWVTDCEDYDPNYKKDRPNQNTSVKQVCGAPELLNVSTLTNTPTQGAFKLINISVEVNGIPAQAFVDTGATVSIINWRLFKRTRLQLQPNSDIHISQADGVTRTCGSLQTKVRIDKLIKPVTLHVMKNFKYPLLIGLDVASLFNLLIDVRDKTIYTKCDGLQNPILVNHLEEIREHELKELLEHNRNVFSQHAIDLGKVAIQHKIITKSEQPISLRPYRRPLKEYEEIAEQVKELLEHNLIRISDSPWAFPVVMVPKKDGNKRMCIDYRRLNEITLDDRQPLPHIQDMFDRLHGSRFFSTLDVAWGYWQIEMDPQSIQKTAFVTNDGHYEFLVMPFGLKNAASTFQRIIQHILVQHEIKIVEMYFGRTEVKYLGHIISHNQLKPDPGKVKSIQDFPRPDTVKKVRQFMGLANYYRKFVKDFSKISFPLVRLTRKNQPFIWNEEVEESFAKLKMALSTKPVLAIYNPDYPSKVYTDASKYGIGAILTQIGPDNEEHVIAYYSKTLQPHQENYSAYEMECLAVIQATDHFHVYIEKQPFEIITDHAALQWLFTMKKPKHKYFRWILSLSSKSCNIVHRSGKQQTHVDALSRLSVVNIATQELQEHQQNSDLSFLKNSHTHDGVVMIKQKGVFKAVVPNSLTKKILEEYHDSLSHPSITKTCKLITQCYWWKGITTDIKNYVRSCKSCQLVKVRH
ncbi:K02A2.6-like [Cordylochernes scorpioides]|uniref:RNA-directed DNA polymerase n=1 Tax=Cordylochernes scorpioides TaxID=51811 RepID=A0ABY6LG76_9ARAC|nr:K02A2.6-like [Cordylochernes scorpioides]